MMLFANKCSEGKTENVYFCSYFEFGILLFCKMNKDAFLAINKQMNEKKLCVILIICTVHSNVLWTVHVTKSVEYGSKIRYRFP